MHVARDLKKYLPLHSPLEATQKLRTVSLPINGINSPADRDCYLAMLNHWHEQYGGLLKRGADRSRDQPLKESGGIPRQLAPGLAAVNRDQSSLFCFLDNPLVPKTNNSLEGVNRHLSRRVGMGKAKQLSFMLWRLAFSRLKTKRHVLTLWAYWKRSFRTK